MCRENVISHEPELNQIGEITGIDVSIICDMLRNFAEEELGYRLEAAENEEEKQELILQAAQEKEKVDGNIMKVKNAVINLIEKLSTIQNLPELLEPTDDDTLYNEEYFSDFNTDTGDGCIGNNFGQDLRNLNRFLDYAIERGSTSVWFILG